MQAVVFSPRVSCAPVAGLGGAGCAGRCRGCCAGRSRGASRTESAYPRLLTASHASDTVVATGRLRPERLFLWPARLLRRTGPAAWRGCAGTVVGPNLEPLGDGGQTARVLRPWRRLMGGSGGLLTSRRCLSGGCRRLTARVRSRLTSMGRHAGRAAGQRADYAGRPGGPLGGGGRGRLVPPAARTGCRHRGYPRICFPVTEWDKVPAILASPALFHELGPQYVGFSGA